MLPTYHSSDTVLSSRRFIQVQSFLQPTQPVRRVARELADPALMDLLNRDHIEMIPALPPLSFRNDEVRIGQHRQVLHHRASIQLRMQFAERTRGERTAFEGIKQPPSCAVTECAEDGIVEIVVYHVTSV